MAIMTEEEADALDELLTKTTPNINPAIKGITAEYIISKALATRQTPEEVIHEMVNRELAATV